MSKATKRRRNVTVTLSISLTPKLLASVERIAKAKAKEEDRIKNVSSTICVLIGEALDARKAARQA